MNAIKHCRKTRMSRLIGWLSILILMPLGIILLITGIYFLITFNILESILSMLIGTFFLRFGAMEQSFEFRKYLITSEGLYVGNRQKAFYSWHQIYEIGIYPFDVAASLQVYDKVICCSLSTQLPNIKHNLFHNACFFAQRNQHKLIIIDYDEETISALSDVCQKTIIDHTLKTKGHIRNARFLGKHCKH